MHIPKRVERRCLEEVEGIGKDQLSMERDEHSLVVEG